MPYSKPTRFRKPVRSFNCQRFPSHLKDQRPNTKWIIQRIVSLRIYLVMTTYPLGNPPKLPDYIKNNRFIIGLEKDEHSRTYKDHLCFFRCLAIGKYKFTRHNCNQTAKELFASILKAILKILKVLN